MPNEPAYKKLDKKLAEVCKERDQMALMLKAVRAIPASGSFEESARSIYDICKSLIGSTCGYVALLSDNGDENEVLFLDDGGLPCSVDPGLPMPIQGLRALAYHTSKAVYENNFMESQWLSLMPAGHVRLDNVMFSPLNLFNKTVGVIGLANKPADFTDEDTKIAESFGDIAALALKHGKLYDDLKEKEKLHREIVENISDAVLIADDDGKFEYVCPNARLIFGYEPEEIKNHKSVSDLLGYQIFNFEEFNEKKEIFNIDLKIKDKRGLTHYLLVNVKKISIGRGTVLYTCRDISDRKEAEKKLEESERKFRTIVNVLPQFVAYTDKDLKYRFINETYEKQFGIKPETILNKTLMEVIGKEAFNKVKPHIEKVFKGNLVNYNGRFDYKNSESLNIDGTLIPDIDANGEVKGYYAVLTDVTQYIKMQEELQVSEERQRQIIENSSAGYFFIDTHGLFQDVNNAWLKLHKYKGKKDVVGQHFSVTQVDEDKTKLKNIIQHILDGKCVADNELSRKCGDGSVGYHIFTVRQVVKDGTIVGMEGFLIDTTEKKKMEKALKESQEIFEKVFNSAPILITLSDIEDGTYIEVNDAFLKFTGYKREAVIGKTSVEIGFVSAKDRKRLKDILVTEGRVRELEFDLTRADGFSMTCLYSGEIIDLQGFNRLLSIAIDITESRKQQDIIQKKQAELEAHTAKLEQMNTALNVLIDHRNDEIQKREKEIIAGFKKLILPYFDMPIKNKSREEIALIFDILNTNIKEILFKGNSSIEAIFKTFTPMEVQVSNLIKQNKSTKEIANILYISPRSVYFHRENIRKKLNLSKKKTSLKTFLQSE